MLNECFQQSKAHTSGSLICRPFCVSHFNHKTTLVHAYQGSEDSTLWNHDIFEQGRYVQCEHGRPENTVWSKLKKQYEAVWLVQTMHYPQRLVQDMGEVDLTGTAFARRMDTWDEQLDTSAYCSEDWLRLFRLPTFSMRTSLTHRLQPLTSDFLTFSRWRLLLMVSMLGVDALHGELGPIHL